MGDRRSRQFDGLATAGRRAIAERFGSLPEMTAVFCHGAAVLAMRPGASAGRDAAARRCTPVWSAQLRDPRKSAYLRAIGADAVRHCRRFARAIAAAMGIEVLGISWIHYQTWPPRLFANQDSRSHRSDGDCARRSRDQFVRCGGLIGRILRRPLVGRYR